MTIDLYSLWVDSVRSAAEERRQAKITAAILREKLWNVLAVCDLYMNARACTPAELKALAEAYEEIVNTGDGETPGAEFFAQFKLEHGYRRIPRGPGDDPDGLEDSLRRAALRGEDV